MIRRPFILFLSILFCLESFSQQFQFSVATDLSTQRNFKKEQQYWAIGQTVHLHFHITPKDGVYTWFAYYSNGHFKNNLVATAKSGVSFPQQIPYVNSARMRLKHLSVGWRRYLKGAADEENKWNLYFYAGFGLLLGRVENSHSVSIDTARYYVPVRTGKANFKRLTLDPGIGWERDMGGDFFIYAETRLWIPTTDYPSNFIFVNSSAPFTAMINVGIRLLF